MKKTVADGWHKVYDMYVYVEGGKVIRGVDEDSSKTFYPYRATGKGLAICRPLYSTFRRGFQENYFLL